MHRIAIRVARQLSWRIERYGGLEKQEKGQMVIAPVVSGIAKSTAILGREDLNEGQEKGSPQDALGLGTGSGEFPRTPVFASLNGSLS